MSDQPPNNPMPQPGAPPPGYPQPGAQQPGYPQPAAQQPGYPPLGAQPQPGYPQPGAPQSGYPPSGYPQLPVTSQPGYDMQQQQQNQMMMMNMQQQPLMAGQTAGWMQVPQMVVPNCPSGLEYLTQVDQLLVHQQVELLEAFTGYEQANRYTVTNTLGQKVFYAMEVSDCCSRNCCGPARPFEMKILGNNAQEIMHITRPYRCTSCCCPCYLQEITVSAPPGQVIGKVEQAWSLCKPKFRIKNAAGETVLNIQGPLCTFSFCGDVEFKVCSLDGSTEVGKITKQWSGFAMEAYTDADNFGVSFPMNLDVQVKATLLAATFLIDFMFFEEPANKK